MRKVLFFLVCQVLLTHTLIAQSNPSYNVLINGAPQAYSLANDAQFTVRFTTDSVHTLVRQEFFFNTNEKSLFTHNNSTVYSLVNLEYIKFRIIREDTLPNKAATTHTKDTSYITFATQQNYPGDTIKNASFFVGSFVKSIAGNSVPENELLDLFLKLNFGQQKYFFSFLGAEAGVGALTKSTTNSGTFRINEAIANLNWAIYRHKLNKVVKTCKCPKDSNESKEDAYSRLRKLQIAQRDSNVQYFNSLNRTGFLGAGLKLFNTQPYIGVHIGFTEINGPLFGSYIMAGYYITPYKVDTTVEKGTNTFRNNIYLEAGLNAFGDHVPSFLKSIRLKFGLMLPIGTSEMNADNKNVMSRLAVEVPLGHAFKF